MRKKLQLQAIAAMKQAEGTAPVFSSLKRTRYDSDGSLLHCKLFFIFYFYFFFSFHQFTTKKKKKHTAFALKELNIVPATPLTQQYVPNLRSLYPNPVAQPKKLESPVNWPEDKKQSVLYLEYDPYTSFGPILDSGKAASFVSQEEHDFLSVPLSSGPFPPFFPFLFSTSSLPGDLW